MIKKFLIKGMGGIGFNLAQTIQSKIHDSKLYIWDFDKVEVSNLNRLKTRISSIGEYKVGVYSSQHHKSKFSLKHSSGKELTHDMVEFLNSKQRTMFIDCSDELSPEIYSAYGMNIPHLKLSYDGLSKAAVTVNPNHYVQGMLDLGGNQAAYQITPSNYTNPALLSELVTNFIFDYEKVIMNAEIDDISFQKVFDLMDIDNECYFSESDMKHTEEYTKDWKDWVN